MGGGVSGLSAAYHLLYQEGGKEGGKERGKEGEVEVVILEARERLGGRAYSRTEDGIDRGKR